MRWKTTICAAAALVASLASGAAFAEKSGGILRIPLITSPASMSIHEESTIAALGPMMGVFNNLIMFDQHVPQNSLSSIVPDLAENWSYSEDNRAGDHIWWVSDVRKFQGHYPGWTYRYNLDGLLQEIHAALDDRVAGRMPVTPI